MGDDVGDLIFELRSYRIRVGAAPRYLQLLQSRGLCHVTRHLPLIGFWMTETGRLNTLHHLWAYSDLDERGRARNRLMADKGWTEGFVPVGFPLIEKQTSRLMTCIQASPALVSAVERRKLEHPNRSADANVLADCLHRLSVSQAPNIPTAEDLLLARFKAVSGKGLGDILTLALADANSWRSPRDDGLHELLRPAAFSPLG